MAFEFASSEETVLPTICVISDSVGITAQAVARATASQFGESNPVIETLSHVKNLAEIEVFLQRQFYESSQRTGLHGILVYCTIVNRDLCSELKRYAANHSGIELVDLISDAMVSLEKMTGRSALARPGAIHTVDQNYFRRIEAIEFTIAHDDGRNPEELHRADIVLLGVSRSSKTPTSIYLAQQGLKVANVPLDIHTEPPSQLYDVDKTRLFGLMNTPEVLVTIRRRRLGRAMGVASDYADPEQVYIDLEESRKLMRKLGAIVVHTENRAVEETAQEILRYYERVHPPLSSSDE